MRKRRHPLFGGTIFDRLRCRFRDPGTDGLGGGPATPEPDAPPTNGGPDRDFNSLSSGTVDVPSDPAVAPTAPAPPAQAPADPNQRAGDPQAGAAAQWQSIREAAQAQGFQFDGTVTDDRTALNFLLAQANRARQGDVYSQLGRQLAPKADQIQQFLRQQSQPAAAEARPPWKAPEFDKRWLSLVERDPATGLVVGKPGCPPEIVQKVNERLDWQEKYDADPAAANEAMVEARARAIAQETFREQFAAQQREHTISQIVQENSTWMYQLDQGGQRLRDYQGQYVPTPVGAAYVQQLRAVQQMGVTDPRQQDALAKQLVRGQYAQAYQAQTLAAQQQAADPQARQALNQPNRNPLQAQPPSQRAANPAATDPAEAGLSLAERIRRELAAEGVTDADILRSAGS